MRRELFCSLDIGSSFLRSVLCRERKGGLFLSACASEKIKGIQQGRISDLAALSESIRSIVSCLSHKSEGRIGRVVVGISGDYVSGRISPAAIAFSDKTSRYIKNTDVDNIRRQSVSLGLGLGDRLLHEFPHGYILDGQQQTNNPVGLVARKLAVQSYILTAPYSVIDNISNAAEQVGIEIEQVAFSPLASSLSILTEEQKNRGVVMLDIGARSTNILFFKDGVLRDYAAIGFGGDDITEGISHSLNIGWSLAEDLKRSYFALSAQEERLLDNIVIKNVDSYTTIQRLRIMESSKEKIEEFLRQVKDFTDRRIPEGAAECGIVGIGGCSYLEGLLEKIEDTVGIAVNLGRVNINSVYCQPVSLEYASAVGLIYYQRRSSCRVSLRNNFQGRSIFDKTTNFVYKLYKDYF